MALLDKLSSAARTAAAGASALAKNAATSTEELIAVQKLKSKISEAEKAIVEAKTDIGELVWQQHQEGADHAEEIEKLCLLIRELREDIARREQEIVDLKAENEALREQRNARAKAAAAAATVTQVDIPTEVDIPGEADAPGEADLSTETGVITEDTSQEAAPAEAPSEEAPAEEAAAEAAAEDDLPRVEADVLPEAEAACDGYCPSCGAQVSAGARFCGVCGARQEL